MQPYIWRFCIVLFLSFFQVNNGDVDLDRGDSRAESVCYTAENPFFIRLLRQGKRQEMQFRTSKKRIKSPLRKGHRKDQENRPPPGEKPQLISSSSVLTSPGKSSHSNGKFSVKIGKGNVLRCTPEGKRRRRSRLVIEPVDLQSAGWYEVVEGTICLHDIWEFVLVDIWIPQITSGRIHKCWSPGFGELYKPNMTIHKAGFLESHKSNGVFQNWGDSNWHCQ